MREGKGRGKESSGGEDKNGEEVRRGREKM